ncbi:PP2C family serine/threonine-protein phosphatase [Clostridium sp. D33t1_170424_F3]|uniref:PP2C family protein-serine/threonine phosphatase n=1 Tax=Clostridium sp. D33t1_170424_F3 TaxID=2787099 RepID=UPI0018A9EBD2|nr:PP2C family serine/threonine-protein phosphatase [Clostridium sp. D33t1_170424_F3]
MDGWYGCGLSLQNARPSNMDSIFWKEQRLPEGPLLLAVVCDGVGSTRDGAFASRYATGALAAWLEETDSSRLGLSLRDRVLGINREVISAARDGRLDAATTLSALLITKGRYVLVHVGDSRIYQCDGAELRQLTRDDLSGAGRLTACIGRWDPLTVQYEEGEADGKSFLLCTDGLYKRIEKEDLQREMEQNQGKRAERVLGRLARRAVDLGETDNISAILLQSRKMR